MAWGKAGSTTLASAGDTITVSGMTSSETNQYMSHEIASGVLNSRMRLGDGSVDTGSNYADRLSNNGTGDSTQTNETDIHILNGFSGEDHFTVGYFINIATEEKLHIGFAIGNTAGVGNAPQRMEIASKWANTSVQFDNIQSSNVGSGSYDIGSNLTALGSDLTPSSAVTFPENVELGSRAEITDTRKIYYKFDANTYHSEVWYELGTAPYAGGRGVFGSGYASTYDDTMDYITIATLGDATDFGDISVARLYLQAVSSRTRGVFGGGHDGSNKDVLDYITFATPSNATDFGNLTAARHATGGVSSGTRGVFGGGTTTTTVTTMDYITIDTLGNADTFGNLSVARQDLKGVSSDTRGIFGGGSGGSGNGNYMDYITIANEGNATNFGNLTMNRRYPAGVSNGTRGIFAGGDSGSNEISMDYITIAANPTVTAGDFGDLTVARHAPAGVSSDTRGVIGGGNSGSISNVMDYITIATEGDATDFGDLTVARNHLAGASRF